MLSPEFSKREMFRTIYKNVLNSTPEEDARRYAKIGSVPLTKFFLSRSELPASEQTRILAHAYGREAGKELAMGNTERANLKIQKGRELRAAATQA